MEDFRLKDSLSTKFPLLIRTKDIQALEKAFQNLSRYELSNIISHRSKKEQLMLFGVLSPKVAAATFKYLPVRVQRNILLELPTGQIATMLTEMPPDDRTATLVDVTGIVMYFTIAMVILKGVLL